VTAGFAITEISASDFCASAVIGAKHLNENKPRARRTRGHVRLVADWDNLANNKDVNPDQPQAVVDVIGLTRLLHAEGATAGTVLRNWRFSAMADAIWSQAGFDTKACHRNVDDDVIQAARDYARDPSLKTLILLGSDGKYALLVEELRAQGIRVVVMGCKRKFSRRLKSHASNIRYIDKLVLLTPRDERSAPNHASATTVRLAA
jgi:hypothetical protein